MKKFYKIIIILSTVGLILPSFGSINSPQVIFAQTVSGPETAEEAKTFGINILKSLPEATKKVWQEDIVPLWRKMWQTAQNWWKATISPQIDKGVSWVSNIWYRGIKPKIQGVLDKIRGLLGQEIEKRKPVIEEEFKKGEKEIGEEIKKEIPTLWQRFWGLIK